MQEIWSERAAWGARPFRAGASEIHRRSRLARFLLLRFPQAHPRPTPVLVDEFDAGSLKCTPQLVNGRLLGIRSVFDTRDCIRGYACLFCQFSYPPGVCVSVHAELS